MLFKIHNICEEHRSGPARKNLTWLGVIDWLEGSADRLKIFFEGKSILRKHQNIAYQAVAE